MSVLKWSKSSDTWYLSSMHSKLCRSPPVRHTEEHCWLTMCATGRSMSAAINAETQLRLHRHGTLWGFSSGRRRLTVELRPEG